MATLYDLAMQYLNQSLPKTFKYDRTNQPGIPTPVLPVQPEDPNAPVKRILPVQGGGGDGFSVYNPDPNRTRDKSNYSPYNYRQAAERNLIGTPGGSLTGTNIPNTSTEVAKLMDMYPDYYQGKQLTGIPGAAQNYLKNSFIGKGLDALGNMMPVNRRAIYENELLGQGIMVNDIGQIVSDGGNINTAENIMAGYNANKVTAETFQKRRDMINAKMKDPAQKAAKLAALDAAEEKMLGTAKTRADMVFDDKSLAKDPGYVPFDDQLDINNMINKEKEDDENFDPTDPLNLNTTTASGFMNFYNPYERDNIVDVQRTKDAVEEARLRDLDAMDPNPNTDNKGFDPGVTPGESGFIGLDKDMDIDIRDIDGPGTYDGPGIVDNRTPEEQAYGSCFIAGTKISMADGTLKNIEDIIVGDEVKGHKEENTVIKLDPTLLANRKLYSFNDNEHYFFTSEHPFMTEEGWKSIKPEKTKERDGVELYNQLKGKLKIGDKLVTENGLIEIKNIKSKEINNPEMPLYNFNVSNDNSYIADKYIVHNKGNQGSADPKIVCTMMNQSYGFGSFRNKIWKKFHKDLSPEYQKGYHKLFLPLVRIAKTNKVVKKILEHIAVHSTIDMRQATRGKMHLLGRIYRKILLPLCYIVGKHG